MEVKKECFEKMTSESKLKSEKKKTQKALILMEFALNRLGLSF